MSKLPKGTFTFPLFVIAIFLLMAIFSHSLFGQVDFRSHIIIKQQEGQPAIIYDYYEWIDWFENQPPEFKQSLVDSGYAEKFRISGEYYYRLIFPKYAWYNLPEIEQHQNKGFIQFPASGLFEPAQQIEAFEYTANDTVIIEPDSIEFERHYFAENDTIEIPYYKQKYKVQKQGNGNLNYNSVSKLKYYKSKKLRKDYVKYYKKLQKWARNKPKPPKPIEAREIGEAGMLKP